jgi:hypothetical protein
MQLNKKSMLNSAAVRQPNCVRASTYERWRNMEESKELLFPQTHRQKTSLSLWLCSPLDLGLFFSFLILYTISRTPWTGDQPVARPVPTHRTTQTQNKRTQTSRPRVGFEPTTSVFERAKTVHTLARAASVIGRQKTGYRIEWITFSVKT